MPAPGASPPPSCGSSRISIEPQPALRINSSALSRRHLRARLRKDWFTGLWGFSANRSLARASVKRVRHARSGLSQRPVDDVALGVAAAEAIGDEPCAMEAIGGPLVVATPECRESFDQRHCGPSPPFGDIGSLGNAPVSRNKPIGIAVSAGTQTGQHRVPVIERIARIAYDVGYKSEVAFNRAFRREYGVPPAAWRRGHAARQV